VAVIFIDGNDLRAAEIRSVLPTLDLVVEALQTGFSTAAPEPEVAARDKVLAHPAAAAACFAEAVDLTTMDGKSLRLELDSENDNRFCKWWRETPAQMQLRIAVRRAGGAVEIVSATCNGRIADKPAGPQELGWDRLFVPDDSDHTLAQLTSAGEVNEFRRAAYCDVARVLGLM